MTKSSKLGSVDNVPSHHSGAQGRDVAGCKRSGAVAKAGWSCSWLRSGSSSPWGAENWRIMLASLIGWHCATASGPWRCASGPPVSAGPGSGVRPPPSHRGWSPSSSFFFKSPFVSNPVRESKWPKVLKVAEFYNSPPCRNSNSCVSPGNRQAHRPDRRSAPCF